MSDVEIPTATCRLDPPPDRAALIPILTSLGQVLDLGADGIRLIPYEMHHPTLFFLPDGAISILLNNVYPEEALRLLLGITNRLQSQIVWLSDAEQNKHEHIRHSSSILPPVSFPTTGAGSKE